MRADDLRQEANSYSVAGAILRMAVLIFQSLKIGVQPILGSIMGKFFEISDQSSEIADFL